MNEAEMDEAEKLGAQITSRTKARVANEAILRSLIEAGPLLSWEDLEDTRFGEWKHYDVPNIDGHCPRCHRDRPFLGGHGKYGEIGTDDILAGSTSIVVNYIYKCAVCEVESCFYLLELDLFRDGVHRVRKIGQFPPVSIALDPDVVKYLDEEETGLLQKGRIAELQGYGIGSLAYYRRVVVSVTEKLLQDLREALVIDELEENVKRLDAVLENHRESDRLKHAAALLPGRMRPGNVNPFALLFGGISAAMKTMGEEDALKRAKEMAESLTTVIRTLSSATTESRRYADAIRELNKSTTPAQQPADGDVPPTGAKTNIDLAP